MRVLACALVVLAAAVAVLAVPNFKFDPLPNGGTNWALLVAGIFILTAWVPLNNFAGSSGWENYRHQSDVCHSYQVCSSLVHWVIPLLDSS